MPKPAFAVILPAAGSSTRFGGPRSKLLADLRGQPVLAHALRAFLRRDDVGAIVVPTQPDGGMLDEAPPVLLDLLRQPRVQVCDGGATRAHSVLNALLAVPEGIEWVAVHDAARPLASQPLIDRAFAAAVEYGASVPAMPVHLTIKQADGPLPARVQRTIPRHTLWAMQTPQCARCAALIDAFARCPVPLDQVTDDVQLIELAGGTVWLVQGEERNLKVTTAMDLKVAEMLMGDDSPGSPVAPPRGTR